MREVRKDLGRTAVANAVGSVTTMLSPPSAHFTYGVDVGSCSMIESLPMKEGMLCLSSVGWAAALA